MQAVVIAGELVIPGLVALETLAPLLVLLGGGVVLFPLPIILDIDG